MPRTVPNFGARTWNLDLMIAGSRTREDFLGDLEHLVNFLGMDTAGMAPDVRSYPLPDGRGGAGLTIMQPYVEMFHQPMTTSFAIIDAWPEHYTLTIKSCIEFSGKVVMQEIQRRFGDVILDCHAWTLGSVARNQGRQDWCRGMG